MKTILFCNIEIEVNDQAEFVTLDKYGNVYQWNYEPYITEHDKVWRLNVKSSMVSHAPKFVKTIDAPTKCCEMKKAKVLECPIVTKGNKKVIEMALIDLYGESENCQENLRVSIQPDGGAISDLSRLSESEIDMIEDVFKQLLSKAFCILWGKEPEITLIYQKNDS